VTPRSVALAALLAVALARAGAADPLAANSALPPLDLPDQHGETRPVDASLRAVVYSRDMGAGDVVKQAVLQAGPTLFDRNHALYVVDLAGMPSLVREWMALPSLRRRPYRLLVDADGAKTADFPAEKGRPTVLFVEEGKVTRIAEPATADELVTMLQPAAR
jgi:hypothetical protein